MDIPVQSIALTNSSCTTFSLADSVSELLTLDVFVCVFQMDCIVPKMHSLKLGRVDVMSRPKETPHFNCYQHSYHAFTCG